ncbi:MAG: hypothetical protein QUV08_07960 [Parasphingorhabdus sp.]|nr:hypothetical protein [Parasphingorhabdus sp.]
MNASVMIAGALSPNWERATGSSWIDPAPIRIARGRKMAAIKYPFIWFETCNQAILSEGLQQQITKRAVF